jgi:pyrophosphate--fructose-6-phosphate 1-phosphotransferase
MTKDSLQQLRAQFDLPLPELLRDLLSVHFVKGVPTQSEKDREELEKQFPKTYGQPILNGKRGAKRSSQSKRVGVVFSGGQAAGGHNVITGLFDALKRLNPDSRLFGFLGGPSGILEGKQKELKEAVLAPYRNQGGFDLIGSGRTKIETEEQLQAALKGVQQLKLDGLVVIGGDDSNTNAALLAEYFLTKGCQTSVIGVPKTIDGDLKNAFVETSFGFDTACRTYSEMIGNIARDTLSARKYFHFIKLMGRSASHIALECALQTQPNFTWIGEEVASKKLTLYQIAETLAAFIEKRSQMGKPFGVILIPEGLIEFIPEVAALIKELNSLKEMQGVREKLSREALNCFDALPETIQNQLLLDRDPHGNVQVSPIETERLLIEMVKRVYKGKFHAVSHFFGYEGRSGYPSNFDAEYCYVLGHTAALLIDAGATGYTSYVRHLTRPVQEWEIGGIPITMLMHLEMRKGKTKPVIAKALVDLDGKAFKAFAEQREKWMFEEHYCYPGPIQFFGDQNLTDTKPITLALEFP